MRSHLNPPLDLTLNVMIARMGIGCPLKHIFYIFYAFLTGIPKVRVQIPLESTFSVDFGSVG